MKLVKKKITVGIPTFNSCNFLKESIESILFQVDLLEEIEILVCDNASDDGTEIMMEHYVNKHPNIVRYIRHESNTGMDRNFWSVIANASGEFVHLLGDDDYYTINGLGRLLDQIKKQQDCDVFCLSNNYLNTLNGKLIENSELLSEDTFCKSSGEKFFMNENLKTLTLSNIVVRKSKCLEVNNIESLYGSNWFHIALLIQIIKPESSTYIFNFNEPLVTVRIGNQRWLEKEGAIVYYWNALSVFSNLTTVGYDPKVFEHKKVEFLPFILNGGGINFTKNITNIMWCFRFFKFYYNRPYSYAKFCVNLMFRKHKSFFEGWESK